MDKKTTKVASHTSDADIPKGFMVADFGAGCFWGVEENFRTMKGVYSTAVGYEGGSTKEPTYKDVCTDATGHAEVVQVVYDPAVITYTELLNAFFKLHDPTQVNRQGPDRGTQYRSVIFYHGEDQKNEAEALKEKLNKSGDYRLPIATQVVAAQKFYRAEEYHQQYLEKRGLSQCHF